MKVMRRILGRAYDIALVRLIAELLFVILPVAFVIRTFVFGLYQVPTGSMERTLLVGERFFADKLTYWFRKPERFEIIAFDDPRYAYSSNSLVNLWQRYASFSVSNWTKRVIGKPGEHIKGVIENGKPEVYIDGKKLDRAWFVNPYPLIEVWKYPQESNQSYSTRRETVTKTFVPEVPWDQQPFYKINPAQIRLNSMGQIATILWPGTPISQDVFDIKLGQDEWWVMGDNLLGSSDSRSWGVLKGNLIHGKIVYRIWSMDSDESWWFIDLIKNPVKFWKKIRWSRCFQFVK